MNSNDSYESYDSADSVHENHMLNSNDSDDNAMDSMDSVELNGNELSAVPDSITLQLTPGVGFGAHRRHNSSSPQTIQLHNSCSHAIAFKIKSKHVSRYRVKPALGIVDGFDQCDIEISIADLGVNPADTTDDVFRIEWCIVGDADHLRQSTDALHTLWRGIDPDDKLFLYVMCLVESTTTGASPPGGGGGPQGQAQLPSPMREPTFLQSPESLQSLSSFMTFLPPPAPSASLPAPPAPVSVPVPPSPRNGATESATSAQPASQPRQPANSPAQPQPLRTFRRSPSGSTAQGQATQRQAQPQPQPQGFRREGSMTVRTLKPPAAAPKKVKLWRKGPMYKQTTPQYLQFTLGTKTTQFPAVNGQRTVRSYAVDFLHQVRPSASLSNYSIVDGNSKTLNADILVQQLPLVALNRQLKLLEEDDQIVF